MIGIYKITNPKGKIYIGESVDIPKRWSQYKNGHTNKQWKLARSISKYGWENHLAEVIVECTILQLRELERYWQLHYDSVCKGLNLKLTGIGDIKTLDSPEVSTNRSNGQRGRRHSQETKDKLSLLRKGRPKPEGFAELKRQAMLGTKQSQEHSAKIAKSKMKPCMIDGITYESIKAAAATIGIKITTLFSRIRNKNYPNCCYI